LEHPFIARGAESAADVEFERLPRLEAFPKMFRKLCRIARSPKCERRKVAGELVMAMAVRGRSRKTRCNDHRAIEADGSDHVSEDLALAPHPTCLVAGLRKAVIHCTGEKLFTAVERTRLEKLFRANDAEGLREF